MLYIPKKIASCGMLLSSSIEMQKRNQDHLFSSFRKGFMEFEYHLIAPDFKSLNNVTLFVFMEQAKEARVVRCRKGISGI